MNTFEALLSEMLGGLAKVALSLDADHQQQLAQLEGRSLRIHCTNPPQKVTLRVTAGSLDIVPGSDIPTDATVTGSISDLLALLRGGSQSRNGAGTQANLQVAGDALTMRDFARFFENYNPDWSTLAQVTPAPGPFPGPGSDLFETLRGTAEVGLASLGKALGGLMQSGTSQVQQATREQFTGDNEFAAATERLQALGNRVQQLGQRIDTLASNKPSSKDSQ